MSEASGDPRTRIGSTDGTGAEPAGLEGAVFPAESDPLGTHALLVRTIEEPHLESLWLVPLDPASGEAPRQLGGEAQMVRNPAWAPDGSFVVYESDHESFRDLYRMGRDGQGPGRLTEAKHGSFEPDVGPDGRIVFVSSRDGDAEIYVMGPRGSHQTRLTTMPGDDMKPAWRPDGSEITWLARRDRVVQLWRMNADGTEPRPFRTTPVEQHIAIDHAWSPDGARVAVTVQTGPRDVAIDLLDASGAVLKRIDGPGPDEQPSWSPDGKWLVFSGRRDGQDQPDLYVVDRDGGSLGRVTDTPSADWLPRWLAEPKAE